MSEHLFNEFNKVSSKEWKQKIQVDLKGLDYQTLITKTLEKIDIKPFYHYDDYISSEQQVPDSFTIGQTIEIHNEKIAHKIAKKALENGAENIIFSFDKAFNYDTLLSEIDFEKLIFKANYFKPDFLIELYQKTKGKSQILVDPIGHFTRFGNWYENEQNDFENLKKLRDFFPKNYRFIEINAHHYKNAGASITQELAYSMSHAVEYVEKLGNNTINQIQFSLANTSHYFFEIAKLKALRNLWQLISENYGIETSAYIFTTPALRNKTIFDPYVNMLRTGMEVMSAILGGSNMVANLPFDTIYKKSNKFSERTARNQLIILKKEAGFDKALNVTKQNYFIEENTYKIAGKAMEIFKSIEKSGGFLSQLYKGKIQEKIIENALKEQADFDAGKLVLVGTNKYPNQKEATPEIELFPFLKKRKSKTLIKPVIPKRLAEKTEQERLKQLGISF